jgi:hypothetical protein
MCEGCNAHVAQTGQYIDRLIAAEKERRAAEPGESNAQHTIGLANIVIDTYMCAPDKAEAIQQMALGIALMTTRMLAVEQIYGVAFS